MWGSTMRRQLQTGRGSHDRWHAHTARTVAVDTWQEHGERMDHDQDTHTMKAEGIGHKRPHAHTDRRTTWWPGPIQGQMSARQVEVTATNHHHLSQRCSMGH
jgi:hypothetical protein